MRGPERKVAGLGDETPHLDEILDHRPPEAGNVGGIGAGVAVALERTQAVSAEGEGSAVDGGAAAGVRGASLVVAFAESVVVAGDFDVFGPAVCMLVRN